MYNNYSKKIKCIDCSKSITNKSKRCHSCSAKERLKDPTNHPNYIDGRTNKQHFCVDCNSPITSQALKCKHCGNKRKFTIERKQNISIATKKAMKRPEVKVKILGKNSANYIHGQGHLSYCPEFSNSLKKEIRERDNYICQSCLEYGNDVHHIDYNKENNKRNNLLTLCHRCNIKVNFNRDYWYAYFTYIMEINYELSIL